MANKIKPLTLTDIDKIHSEYEEQNEVKFVHNGKEFLVKVDKKFTITKLNDLVVEFAKKALELQENGIELDEEQLDQFSKNIAFVLILKHFTTMPIQDNLTSTELLDVFKKIVNIGLFDAVWTQGFDPNEVDLMLNRLMQVIADYAKVNGEANEKMLKDMEEAIAILKQNNEVGNSDKVGQ